MAVTIRVALSHPRFFGLAPEKIRFVLGPQNGSVFFPWTSPDNAAVSNQIGMAGSNRAIMEISGSRPIQFADNNDFLFLGNVSDDAFQANRTKAQLILLMRKGYIIVTKDGTPLAPEDVADFTP